MCCGSDVRHTGFLQKIFLNAWFSIEVDKNFLHLTPSVLLGVQLMSNKRELLCLVDRHGRMLTNPKWEMKWKSALPVSTEEGDLWAGPFCSTWQIQQLSKSVTLQQHNHYNCYTSMGASILTLGDFLLIIKLSYLGVILQFL